MKRLPSRDERSALMIHGVVSEQRLDGWALGRGRNWAIWLNPLRKHLL